MLTSTAVETGFLLLRRPTMALRFINSLSAAVAVAHKPSALKTQALTT